MKTYRYAIAAIAASLISMFSIQAGAETVLFEENFDGDYTLNFTTYDGDSKQPATSIQALFLAPSGVYMPWWVLRESATATDRFIGSHSYYSPAGMSNDWLISVPLTIPSENFVLSFDAQSVTLRGASYLSNLKVFITETQPGAGYCPTSGEALLCKQVPAGATADVTTDEWTNYTLSMDPWVGKTVYVSFVNQNLDKDILCIDNVKISRADIAELSLVDVPEYINTPEHTFTATIKAATGDVTNWKLTFTTGSETRSFTGASITKGNQQTVSATLPFPASDPSEYTVTLTADNMLPVQHKGSLTRLAFETTRRVLIEETTGLWCSNCPRGIYNIEGLMDDPDIASQVVPVSVHTSGASTDYMAMDTYADNLGLKGIAPVTRINRGATAVGFSTLDNNYNPAQEGSFANRIFSEARKLALFDIDVDGEWVVNGNDTTAIKVTARVRPAINIPETSRYRVGFILTENNVGLDNNPYWIQENGVAGYPIESTLGGFTKLPSAIINMRFHYVARANPTFGGILNSLPAMEAGNEYTVTSTILLPNTYRENATFGMVAHAIRTEFCDITAYIVDTSDKTIANCSRSPLNDKDYRMFRVTDLVTTPGDINNDGKITSLDLGMLINILCGLDTANAAADVNSDGRVTSTDIGVLVNIIAGL